MTNHTTESADGKDLHRVHARLDAERRTRLAARDAARRNRIIEAAGIDPAKLSDRARRILDWLAGWDTPTTDGIVDLLTAARTAAEVAEHREVIERKKASLRESEARLDAAFDLDDERWGPEL